ncbi:MAG: electron transport complex subunit RsxC [Ruminococcus sp.]|nr:electron transport complex subunit RsxC [Ruminococcus sp.]
MRKLGGIRLSHHKGSENCKSQPLPRPEKVCIPMSMHIGAPCSPIVKKGDLVTVGQKIGDTDAFMSAPIHSSVSGKVTAISDYRMSNGRTCKLVEIQTDEEQAVCPDVQPPAVHDKDSFLSAIRESGLTGMGGASFPAHVKLAPRQKVDTLCINGAECEPYITSDYRQMAEAPDEVIDGALQVMKWLDLPRCVIGIESNKPEAIRILTERAAAHPEITVVSLPCTYPQGAEKVLIYNTLGRIVMEGQLPADQGVIVMNVSSVAFVSRYLKTGMPMVTRMVTVDGDVIGNRCNVVVPVGTPVKNVLEFAQCDLEKAKKILYGGPMMGVSVQDINDPVLKANNAILAFSEAFAKKHSPKATACIHCGRCISACPLNLMPPDISRAYARKDTAALEKLKVTLCMNCGCCTYVCPAKRPVAEINQFAKALAMSAAKK